MKKGKKLLLTFLFIVAATCLFGCAVTAAETSGKGSSATQSGSRSVKQSVKGESDFDDVTAIAENYNVVFNPNYDGAAPNIVKVDAGQTVSEPVAPVRDGALTFDKWYTDKNCTKEFDFSSKIDKNIVLFAGWISGNVTVTFNYNYVGAPAVERETIVKGGTVDAPADPQRDKYAFDGWYDGETKYDFTAAVNANVTLYAHWRLTKATINFDYNYQGAPENYTTDVDIGASVNAPEQLPERVEYDFDKWLTSNGADYDFTASVTEDITLYGSWKLKTFTVTFDGNGYEAGNSSIEVEYGGKVNDPAIEREGYICIWTLDGEAFNFTNAVVTGNIKLIASWEEQIGGSVVVTYYYNFDGSQNNGVYFSDEIDYGSIVFKPDVDPARPGNDYMFMEWCTDEACTTQYQFGTALLKNLKLYAKWYAKSVFEAEYVDLTGKYGYGFSANYFETDMVQQDDGSANASNGYYLTGLYYEGAYIDFVINSDRDIDDAVLVIRIQTEYDDKTFDPDIFGIYVNGSDYPLDYDQVTFTTDFTRDSTSSVRNEFVNVVMIDSLELKKGENVIRLQATNNITHGNTRKADAPMIDCIYIYSNAVLTWSPKTSNIDG